MKPLLAGLEKKLAIRERDLLEKTETASENQSDHIRYIDVDEDEYPLTSSLTSVSRIFVYHLNICRVLVLDQRSTGGTHCY